MQANQRLSRCHGIAVLDDEGREAEVDYENIGLLGPNLDLYDLAEVGALNYLCDDYGLDTISAGGVAWARTNAVTNSCPIAPPSYTSLA